MTQAPLHLGALPPEVFDKIFSELETIRDLANFVLTVRFIYCRFKARQETILYRVLQNELGPALPDARFLFLFPYADPADMMRYHDWIYTMAGVYRDMLPRARGLSILHDEEGNGPLMPQDGEDHGVQGDPGPPPLRELTALCRTLHDINFLTDAYITTQLAAFARAGGTDSPATAPLSPAERHRTVRAFYRRQIVSNAWAPTRRLPRWLDKDSHAYSNTRTDKGPLGLLATFDPWEMQQIDHADDFVSRLCVALVHRAADAGGEEGAGAVVREILPRQFGDLYAQLGHLVRYLRAWPGMAAAALGGPMAGRSLSSEHVYREYEYHYRLLPLTGGWQHDQSVNFADDVFDTAEGEGLLVDESFVGDGLGDVPFGWWDALRGHHVKKYGEGLSSIPWLPDWVNRDRIGDFVDLIDLWRRAGFAFWGRERVEALKRLRRFEGLRTGFVVLDRP